MIPVLATEHLELKRSGRNIFHVDNFALHRGEVLALVGPNGAGKTSLLLTLALLERPTAGVILFNGHAAGNGGSLAVRRRMAVVFQESLLLDMSVQANLVTALRIRGIRRKEAEARTREWLERFGVLHLARQSARSLSGGEAQRTSLARAFALEPEVLFLDEPFAALDYPTRKALLAELGQILRERSIATLFITHDYTEIPHLATQSAVMYEGRIVKYGTVSEVFGEALMERESWAPWVSHIKE